MISRKVQVKMKKIFAKYGIRFAYLFGSRATEKGMIATSDYDFAVFFGKGTAKSRFAMRLKLIHEMQAIMVPAVVDLVVLDDVQSVTLRNEIVRTGLLIYVKDTAARINFEFRVMHDYEEFMPFLKAYNEAYMIAV